MTSRWTPARGIVAENGLSALTARKVAQAIGYSPGTLYNVFDDLDDLIVSYERPHSWTRSTMQLSSIPQTGDPARDLNALLAGYLSFLDGNAESVGGPVRPQPIGRPDLARMVCAEN